MGIVVIEVSELQRLIEAAVVKAIENASLPKHPIDKESAKLLTIEEAAALLQVSLSSIYAYKKQGKLPFHRMGRRIFFKEHEILGSLKAINK